MGQTPAIKSKNDNFLVSNLRGAWSLSDGFREALRNKQPLAVTGVLKGARAWFLIEALLVQDQPLVVILRNEDDVLDLASTLNSWQSDKFAVLTGDENESQMLAWLGLARRDVKFVLTTVDGLAKPVPEIRALLEASWQLKMGQELSLEDMVARIGEAGYQKRAVVIEPGDYCVHGGILDLFCPGDSLPRRIEFWDEKVNSLRTFDPGNQRSKGRISETQICPYRLPCKKNFLTFFSSSMKTVWIDPARVDDQAKNRADTHENPVAAKLWKQALKGRGFFIYQYGPPPLKELHEFHIPLKEPGFARGRPEKAVELAKIHIEAGHRLIVVSSSAEEDQSVQNLFDKAGLPKHSYEVVRAFLSQGFAFQNASLWILSAQELFHSVAIRFAAAGRKKSLMTGPLGSLGGLEIGDLVVHRDYGIGRYEGLTNITTSDMRRDFLKVAYAGGDLLYVPTYGLSVLSPYEGGGRPRLFRLGGDSWLRLKSRAKKSLKDLAIELLKVQAERQRQHRAPYASENPWIGDLESSFPYELTPDQARTMEEISEDLAGDVPMDRLLVGDVGFGKTEIAVRTAFRVASEGRQVAVLVPTTVLAEQHLAVFAKRLSVTPARVAALSRLTSRADQTKILKDLAQGKVDIIIGTQRLLSGDVVFKDLALLIIDEEHRFGVQAKERFKKLRSGIDVLTLSATPIPRSFQMTLSGLRGLSRITTAPPGRLAVETRVMPENIGVIRTAILNELQRGGQVFYVVGKIRNIKSKVLELAQNVPEAKVGFVHGRMSPAALEKAMHRFYEGEEDVLVATTLIESGLDIPRVNTLIVSRAQDLGLAQLYQLRGRVGRSDIQAYAYLLAEHPEALSRDARKRLDVMRESSALGSGYRLALRDLQIRGAGNILGREQHGHLASLGYAVYTEIFSEVFTQAAGLLPAKKFITEVDLPIEAYLPESFLPESGLRLEFYQKLSLASSADEVDTLNNEIVDRFGPLPMEVEGLLAVAKIRVKAADRSMVRVRATKQFLVFEFTKEGAVSVKPEQLARRGGQRVGFNPQNPFQVRVQRMEDLPLLEDTDECLEQLFPV